MEKQKQEKPHKTSTRNLAAHARESADDASSRATTSEAVGVDGRWVAGRALMLLSVVRVANATARRGATRTCANIDLKEGLSKREQFGPASTAQIFRLLENMAGWLVLLNTAGTFAK